MGIGAVDSDRADLAAPIEIIERRDRIAARGFRGIDPASQAAACVALLRCVPMQWLVDPRGFGLAAVAERVTATIRRGLAV